MTDPERRTALLAFARGFMLPVDAARLLLQSPGLKRYALLPLAVNIVVYAFAFALMIILIARWNPSVGDWTFWDPVGPWLAAALNWSLGTLKWLVSVPVMLVASYFTFTVIGLTIAAPFNDLLSARVEAAICARPNEPAVPLSVSARQTVLGILDGLTLILKQLVIIVLVLPLLGLPLIGMVPLMVVIAWFAGLGFLGIATANHSLRSRHVRTVTATRRAEILGLGFCMELLFIVPFAALFMLPLGTTAGTLLYCDIDWRRALADAGVEPPPGFQPPVRAGAAEPPVEAAVTGSRAPGS